jgi:Cys-tRNA(Pro) deacylase
LAKDKMPVTSAIRFLREHHVEFIERPYKYEEKGGTKVSAKELGVEEHLVIKTLVMEDDRKVPLIVLMHGDREVSTKELARVIGVRSVSPCTPETALKHTGYMVGGISPFGTKKPLPVYVEEAILSLPRIYINAGRRGLLCEISPSDLVKVLNPVPVNVAR